MSEAVYRISMLVIATLMLAVLIALFIVAIREHRNGQPVSKKKRKRKKKDDGLPWWVYLLGALLALALVATILAGIYFAVKAVWLFLAAHMWIVWVTFTGIGLWAAIRSIEDEDAPTWVQIVGVLFMAAVVLAVLFGLYLAVTAVIKMIVAVISTVVLWVTEAKEVIHSILSWGAVFVAAVLLGIVLIVISSWSEESNGHQRSKPYPSTNSESDDVDWGGGETSRDEDGHLLPGYVVWPKLPGPWDDDD